MELPLDEIERERHAQAWVARNFDHPLEDQDITYWSTVCRKLLQRGTAPPVSPLVESALLEQWLPPVDLDVDAVRSAIVGPDTELTLDSGVGLHEALELPFWELLPAGLRRFIHPQVSLESLAGLRVDDTRRWVDFVISAPWRPAPRVIEIDGSQHTLQPGVDAGRDRLLKRADLTVRRFHGSEAVDPQSRLHHGLARVWEARPTAGLDALCRLVHGPAAVHRFAYAIIEGVAHGVLSPGVPWRLEVDDPLDVIAFAAGHVLDTLAAVGDVWGVEVVPDVVLIAGHEWIRDAVTGRFVRSDPEASAAHGLRPDEPSLRITLEPFNAPHGRLPDPAGPAQVIIRSVGLPLMFTWNPPASTERRDDLGPAADRALEILVNDVFAYPELRPGQLDSLRQILGGGDCLALLPTGSGKSLIYQLAGLLRPGTTLVIDPIVSLIDDQVRRLREEGIDRVEPIHRAALSGNASEVFDRLARGETLFAFCTPERFQSQEFRTRLGQAAEHHLVALAVVDEAHCVSEWGHDFRTSYLRLGRNLRNHACDAAGNAPVLLALTGTASPAVLRDVLRELDIDATRPGALQRPDSFDRPNLRYAVIVGKDRRANLTQALTGEIPSGLGVEPENLPDLDGSKTLGGLVFCPHVNGRFGVLEVAKEVRDILQTSSVDYYAGSVPSGWGGSDWDRHRAEVARRFYRNDLAALVATKAFGMGIDKANIAWTVHVGIPGSIEAFAQESGRAGRDGRPAICVLNVHPANTSVADRLLDPEADGEQRRAIYAKAASDNDLKRQLFFHFGSFPNINDEVSAAVEVWEELREGGASPTATVILPRMWPNGMASTTYAIGPQDLRGPRDCSAAG